MHRNQFTASEASQIRNLLVEVRRSKRAEQKRCRQQVRNIGFHISDFDVSARGFGPNDFDALVSSRRVSIISAQTEQSPKLAPVASDRTREPRGRGEVPVANRPKRKQSDESYIIDLCDRILECSALRQHRFQFLRGDKGHLLPVDAYYPKLRLVIEYRELQHTEGVALWDKKPTVSGIPRGPQRAVYDQRRRDILPQHGIDVVELSFTDFKCDGSKRLLRNESDAETVIRKMLARWITQCTEQGCLDGLKRSGPVEDSIVPTELK